jgi:hypothetical protein
MATLQTFNMSTALPGDWQRNVDFNRGMRAAGFSVDQHRTIGDSSETVLCLNGVRFVGAVDHGDGDGFELRPPIGGVDAHAKNAMRQGLIRLASLQAVTDYLRPSLPNTRLPEDATDHLLGHLIRTFAENEAKIARVIASTAGRLAWVPPGTWFGLYAIADWLDDTPENRTRLLREIPKALEGHEGFVSDLLADVRDAGT